MELRSLREAGKLPFKIKQKDRYVVTQRYNSSLNKLSFLIQVLNTSSINVDKINIQFERELYTVKATVIRKTLEQKST